MNCWVNNAGSADKADVGRLIDLTEPQWDAVVDRIDVDVLRRAGCGPHDDGRWIDHQHLIAEWIAAEPDDRPVRHASTMSPT